MGATTRKAAPEVQLYELEAKMLDIVDSAWDAYQDAGGGMPPTNLLKAIQNAHTAIMNRISKRLGFTFDPNNLPAALIEMEKQREIILKMMAQRNRDEAFHS